MLKALYKRRREFTFTGHGKFGAWLGRHNPGLVHLVMTRMGGSKQAARIESKSKN